MKMVTTKSVIENVPELKGKLSALFFDRITSILNRSKGSSYEKMATAIVLANAVEELDIKEPLILVDKKVFACYEDGNENRRCDIYLENRNIAYEVKSYRPCLCRFVREQIKKDAWLLNHQKVDQIWWLLFQGATSSVLKALTSNGITYIDVLNTSENFTNIPLLFGQEKVE